MRDRVFTINGRGGNLRIVETTRAYLRGEGRSFSYPVQYVDHYELFDSAKADARKELDYEAGRLRQELATIEALGDLEQFRPKAEPGA